MATEKFIETNPVFISLKRLSKSRQVKRLASSKYSIQLTEFKYLPININVSGN